MNWYEIAAVIVALLAFVLSIIALRIAAKTRRESKQLQATASELSKKQAEMLTREEEIKSKARLSLSIIKDMDVYRFRIENVSNADAKDVDIKFMVEDPNDNPVVQSDYEGKFPVPVLTPKGSITFVAKLNMDKPMVYNAVLTWTNPDGSKIEEKMAVSM
jgi:hypothetical protein